MWAACSSNSRIKPDAEAFAQVVDALQCSPAEVLFLDDNRLDVDAARHFRMRAVRVLGSAEAHRTLVKFGIIE
jgi:putative hydrolase of the HAD superfamily